MTTFLMVIGILFVINGITSTQHTKAVADVRSRLPKNTPVYHGGANGFVLIASADVMLSANKSGKIEKAYMIKSGWLRKTRFEELPLAGCSMKKLADKIQDMKAIPQRACRMAIRQYEVLNKK